MSFFKLILSAVKTEYKDRKAGFWFLVVLLIAVLAYADVPKLVVWYFEREDAQKREIKTENDTLRKRLDVQYKNENTVLRNQLRDCDSLSRQTTLQLIEVIRQQHPMR